MDTTTDGLSAPQGLVASNPFNVSLDGPVFATANPFRTEPTNIRYPWREGEGLDPPQGIIHVSDEVVPSLRRVPESGPHMILEMFRQDGLPLEPFTLCLTGWHSNLEFDGQGYTFVPRTPDSSSSGSVSSGPVRKNRPSQKRRHRFHRRQLSDYGTPQSQPSVEAALLEPLVGRDQSAGSAGDPIRCPEPARLAVPADLRATVGRSVSKITAVELEELLQAVNRHTLASGSGPSDSA